MFQRLSNIRASFSEEDVSTETTRGRKKILVGYDVINETPYELDISKTRHILIVAIQGTGKSVILHSLISQYKDRGCYVDIVNDKHGEFRRMQHPNHRYDEQLKRGADIVDVDVEEFAPLDTVPHGWVNFQRFSPEFCHVPGTEPFSFKITDLEEDDWLELFAISSGHLNRKLIFQLLYNHFKKMREVMPNFMVTKEVLRQCADVNLLGKYTFFLNQAVEQLNQAEVQMEIERFWKDFIQDGVFEGSYVKNAFEILYDLQGNRQSTIVDWSMFKEGITRKGEMRRDAIIAILLNMLFEWNKTKTENVDSITGLDDAQKILASDRSPYTANYLKTIFSEGRKFGQHVVCAFQGELHKVHSLLYENADFLLIGSKNCSRKSLKFLQDSYPNVFEWRGEVRSFAQLPMHTFLAIDKYNEEVPFTVVVGYPPTAELVGSK